jgi:hypothetical protein
MKTLNIVLMLLLLIVCPYVLISANASDTPAPLSVTVAGSLQSELGCAGDWDPVCPVTHLDYDGNDAVWQKTFSVPAGSWEYKAALNDSWDENYGIHAQSGGANIPLNLGVTTNVKFYYDHETHWITDNVNSIIVTAPGSYQSEIGCLGDWDPGCLRSWLQDPDGDGIYSFHTMAIPGGTYEAKVAINESWDVNYGSGGVQNGPNIQFTVPPLCNETTFSYNSNTHILSVNSGDNTPPEVTCPDNIMVNACTNEVVNYIATATDSCGLQDFSCNPPPGSSFPVGNTMVTCTAVDLAENSASCSFAVNVNCPTPICRSAGFWGTHAGTECPKKKPNCGSQNITQAVINECDSCLDICGEIITNTGSNNANSAIEAICVSPASDNRLQLARQLTVASLNCCLSDGESDCKGLSDWDNVFNFCNSACALNLSDSFKYCINALDCLNSGGKVIEQMGDTVVAACQTGTCQPSAGNDIPCGKNLPACSVGSCVPFQETCYTKNLCNEDLGLCFNTNAPAGSSDACTLATGDGKGKNAGNYCAILPMLNPPEANCSKLNQGEECCSSDVEQSCKACEHSLCEVGLGLDPFCDPCVTTVCFDHPECCVTEVDGWNASCISYAVTICGISCNTIGWANLQWPPTMTHTISAINRTDNAYGQVWIDGVTNQPGQTPGLRAQLGYGPVGSDPDSNPSWVWVDASFNVDAGNNDEFVASMLPDMAGQFDYLYRYSTTDGLFWLYADLNGPITAGTLPPNPGKLTVDSSGDTIPPASPSNLIVASVSENSVELSWDAVVGDPTMYGYEVLRGDVSGGPYTVAALVGGTTHYIDMAVETGQTYFYVVRAVDLSFNRSAISNEVQATPEVRTVTVTFNVTVPLTTDGTGKSVYIAGSLSSLDGNLPSWNADGVVLTQIDSTHWTITLTGIEGTMIEYKYTLGSWDYVEKDSSCGEIANRQLTLSYGINGMQTVNDTVLNWRNVAPCGN